MCFPRDIPQAGSIGFQTLGNLISRLANKHVTNSIECSSRQIHATSRWHGFHTFKLTEIYSHFPSRCHWFIGFGSGGSFQLKSWIHMPAKQSAGLLLLPGSWLLQRNVVIFGLVIQQLLSCFNLGRGGWQSEGLLSHLAARWQLQLCSKPVRLRQAILGLPFPHYGWWWSNSSHLWPYL